MSKIKEVLRLKYLNLLSNRQIQTITGVSRNSVANYVNAFNEMNLSLEKMLVLKDDEIEQFFHPKKPLSLQISTTQVDIDWNNIHQELSQKGMTRKLLYEEIASTNPNIYSYSQFNRYYNKFVKTINPSMNAYGYTGTELIKKSFEAYSKEQEIEADACGLKTLKKILPNKKQKITQEFIQNIKEGYHYKENDLNKFSEHPDKKIRIDNIQKLATHL